MTPFAGTAETSLVFIVLFMAGIAVRGLSDFVPGWRDMALFTGQILMRSFQFKIGLGVMVECPQAPGIRVVTQATCRTQGQLVLIIFLMTGITVQRCMLECRRDMALFTGRRGVQTEQWKASQIMIKDDFFRPATFLVALRACLTFLALVNIITAVAVYTLAREFFLIDIAAMTGRAGELPVLAF